MPPEDYYEHDQFRIEQQQAIAAEMYQDGATDAAAGISPTSKDAPYLDGYLTQLRELILHSPAKLQIRWLSPAFMSGGHDYDARDEF